MDPSIQYMPAPSHESAPRFKGNNPHELRRYFDDLEHLFTCCKVTDEAARKRYAVRYVDIDTEDFWRCIPGFEGTALFADFRTAIYRFYPGADEERRFSIADMESLSAEWLRIGIRTQQELGDYHRKFHTISGFLLSKSRISDIEARRSFARGFPSDLWNRIIAHLQIKLPDQHPDDTYSVQDVYDAAKFILYGTQSFVAPSITLSTLANTTQQPAAPTTTKIAPIFAPHSPIPVALSPAMNIAQSTPPLDIMAPAIIAPLIDPHKPIRKEDLADIFAKFSHSIIKAIESHPTTPSDTIPSKLQQDEDSNTAPIFFALEDPSSRRIAELEQELFALQQQEKLEKSHINSQHHPHSESSPHTPSLSSAQLPPPLLSSFHTPSHLISPLSHHLSQSSPQLLSHLPSHTTQAFLHLSSHPSSQLDTSNVFEQPSINDRAETLVHLIAAPVENTPVQSSITMKTTSRNSALSTITSSTYDDSPITNNAINEELQYYDFFDDITPTSGAINDFYTATFGYIPPLDVEPTPDTFIAATTLESCSNKLPLQETLKNRIFALSLHFLPSLSQLLSTIHPPHPFIAPPTHLSHPQMAFLDHG